jgi:DNA-directed RNA polymerase
MDKANRTDQLTWVGEHGEDLVDLIGDPFGRGLDFWLEADEKHRWQFLAAAIDYVEAWQHPEGPEAYVSHLPVHVDGSCNGLQHLSAMGRDPVGAHATNLTADPERQDIYQIVADKVNGAIRQDCIGEVTDDPCWSWWGKVTRNTVKRGVMTMPYGLTPIGMRDQLIDDRWTSALEGDDYDNAGYLRDLMLSAIEGTVKAAAETMAWMQDNSTILAKNKQPVEWWAPSGFKVRQCYRKINSIHVQTIIGDTRLTLRVLTDEDNQELRVSKQASSIAPNVIHSFDAAHMMMSIASGDFRWSFSVIHDSFGVHACDMSSFLMCIKDEFVAIYEHDWFASLQEDFETSRDGEEYPLIQPPTHGNWKPEEVLKSDFFFA